VLCVQVLIVVFMTWAIPISVFFTSIIGWQYFAGRRTVPAGKCYVQYMEDAVFNCILQVRSSSSSRSAMPDFHNSYAGTAVFTARCYASPVLAMGLCLSVCLSVRHKSVFYRNG